MQSRLGGGGGGHWEGSSGGGDTPSDYHNESNTRDTPYNMCRNWHYRRKQCQTMHLINDSDAKRYNRPQMRLVNKESLRKDLCLPLGKRGKEKRERKRRRDLVASLGDEVRSCRLGRKENGRRRERRTPRERR